MARPEKPIDWDLVDQLLMADCHGTDCAAEFDMHPDTFYRKVQEKYNIGFTELSLQRKKQGDSNLRAQQYKKALGQTDKGDNTLLIWLGKTRLKQRENDTSTEYTPELLAHFARIMAQVAPNTQSDLKIDTNNSNNEL